jgi:hypothetical protein
VLLPPGEESDVLVLGVREGGAEVEAVFLVRPEPGVASYRVVRVFAQEFILEHVRLSGPAPHCSCLAHAESGTCVHLRALLLLRARGELSPEGSWRAFHDSWTVREGGSPW